MSATFQQFLDDAVARDVAPGFQCVVFDRDTTLFNGVSGLARAPSLDAPEGKRFKPETPVYVASCTKIAVSLIVLHLIDRGLTKSGFSMQDLDNHEALVEVLPEFKHGSESLLTKIIEGFEEKLGTDGKRVMKLKESHGKVTLRMLLTHTAGMAYRWNHPLLNELYKPSDGSTPNFGLPSDGSIRDFSVPLVTEPGTSYCYSTACDWLGQFAVRASEKNLRQLLKEIIFEPLHIPPSEADIWLSPEFAENSARVHLRDQKQGYTAIPLTVYTTEDTPPEGKAYSADGCIWASLQAYAKVLQAVLRQDPRILSKGVWATAMKDDLKDRGIPLPKPLWKSAALVFSEDVHEYAKSTAKDGAGVNLLQCNAATAPTISGRSVGSFGWGGIANTYFFIDPIKEVGAIFGTQLLPFCHPALVEMRDQLEMLVYKNILKD